MKSRKTMDLTTGSVTRKLLVFVFPMLITYLLQQLYQAADNAVVGRFAGSHALAAVGATGSATALILNLSTGFAVGSNIINANLLGAKKMKELRLSMHAAVSMSFISGALVAIVGLLAARPLLLVMSCPESILDDALVYMRIILFGAPATMIYNFGAGILRTHGDSKAPLRIMAVSGLVNVLLNLFFVLCLDMTVDGVAWATTISKYLSAAWALFILFDPKGEYKMTLKELKPHKRECISILKVGFPCCLNGVLFSVSNVIVSAGVNGFGDIIIAGNVAANNITSLLYQVILAFYNGCINFVGQCYGAGKHKRIDEVIVKAALVLSAFMITVCTVLTIFPKPFLSIFNDEPEVIAAGIPKLVIMCWAYWLFGLSDIMTGALRGMKRTTVPMLINVFCVCVLRVSWIWFICPFRPESVMLVYCCYPASYICSLSVLCIYYFIVRKQIRKKAEQRAAAAANT